MNDHGLISRNYDIEPVGSVLPAHFGPLFPRKDWPELIKLQEKRKASPLDVHQYNDVPILDQGRLKYCWQFSNKGYFNFKNNIPKILGKFII